MTPLTKRLAIALCVSLAINLLAAGFVFGRGWRRPSPEHGPHMMEWMSRGRGPWRRAFEPHHAEFRGQTDALRAARLAARNALLSPNFERDSFERALGQVRAETTKSQELLHRALVEAAVSASPGERRELARTLETHER